MKKKTRKKIFQWSLIVVALAAAAAAVLYFYPRPAPPSVKVYFFKGEKLFAVERPLQRNETPLKRALEELLAGPDQEESGQGIATQLPAGIKILNARIKGPTAIVNFSRKLEAYGGGSTRLQGMIAQIVYTATDIPGVEKAWIWIESRKEVVLGGEGLVLDHPLSRGEISY